MKTIEWIEECMGEAETMILDGHVGAGMRILNGLLFDEPGYGSLHNTLGWAYLYHANDAAKAEMHLKMAVRFAPDFAPAYLHLGKMLNRAGRYEEALHYLREGLTKPEAYKSAFLEAMAFAYELRKEYGRAIRKYKEAATETMADYEVDRMLRSAKRCRRKKIAVLFSFW